MGLVAYAGDIRPTIFDSAEALGRRAAVRILEEIDAAITARGHAVLGCPGGRSAMSTYRALAAQLSRRTFDGAKLHLALMDEYVERRDGVWHHCPAEAHYSCLGFAERIIRGELNRVLARPIPRENLHLPDAREPEAYETVLAGLGGIDLFLLASGASDGHVAFNPPGTPREAGSRRVALAVTTRQDNMRTFPAFKSLEEVPRFGVSVGPATIARHSGSAVMILIGAEKGRALQRILGAKGYDPDWPATVIHECRDAEILADEAAIAAMRIGGKDR